jgi:DNA-3-methyladenine glycosylase
MSIPHQGRKVNLSDDLIINNQLPRSFYSRETHCVARELLGKRVVRSINGQRLSGIIVEAEAYGGEDDAASHAYRGHTPRNWPMFDLPGLVYVYFIYGVHWMFNIVAHPEHIPGAVLIRALAPDEGLDMMRENRGGKPERLLTNGPARLAQALAIDKTFNGVDLCTHDHIAIETGWDVADTDIASGLRIRVPGDDVAKNRPWRFWIQNNPFVSS